MDIKTPLELLGGISPADFTRRYWQKKPLLIRQAIKGFRPILDRTALFELASHDDVESRLIIHDPTLQPAWRMRRGPFGRRQLPALKQPGWTLLVQGVDLHLDAAHALLACFRFLPDARLDDLMISYASDAGGVGPHFDSYDVFLLQAHGRRRWRIGRQQDLSFQEGVPLKILQHFEPEEEFVLEPGDMLYLPPRYAHDGVAEGECMTYSVGFRSPSVEEIQRSLLAGMADHLKTERRQRYYSDAALVASPLSALVPEGMRQFARRAVVQALQDPQAIDCALGEYLSEPKPGVWFDGAPLNDQAQTPSNLVLDRRTRMLYDDRRVFINGESYVAKGQDFKLLCELANQRRLAHAKHRRLSAQAQAILQDWLQAGWIHLENA